MAISIFILQDLRFQQNSESLIDKRNISRTRYSGKISELKTYNDHMLPHDTERLSLELCPLNEGYIKTDQSGRLV